MAYLLLLLVYQGAAGLMVAETCLHSTGTMAGITQVGRVGVTGRHGCNFCGRACLSLPFFFFSTQSSIHQDSRSQLCLTKDGPQTASEVVSWFQFVPSVRPASSLGLRSSSHSSAPVHRSLACWARTPVRLQQDLALLQVWLREPTGPDGWILPCYPPNTRNGLPPVSLFENH